MLLNQRGHIQLITSLPRLVITATDRGSPRLAGSATLTVIIVDQNDNSPTIPLPQEIRISESTQQCSVTKTESKLVRVPPYNSVSQA